jgi:hypothetical protein
MEIFTFLVASLAIFVLLELLEFKMDLLEKLGVNPFLIKVLVSVWAAFTISILDKHIH